MATRDTEGRREIEAARQRLSAAKSHETFISKSLNTAKQMFDTAKKNLEDIQLQSISSKKEVEDAKKALKEAEKRWEVIEIDLDDQEGNTSSTNKKRKLSSVVSPQGNDNNNESSVTVTIPYQRGKKLGFVLIDTIGDQTRRIRLSPNSAIFKFTKQLLLEKSKGQSGVFDPLSDDVEELIDWGKDNPKFLIDDAQIQADNVSYDEIIYQLSNLTELPVFSDAPNTASFHDWQIHYKYFKLMQSDLLDNFGISTEKKKMEYPVYIIQKKTP